MKSIDLQRLLELFDEDIGCQLILRIFEKIAADDEIRIQKVIDLGLIDRLVKSIEHPEMHIRDDTCTVLSYLTSGNKQQIQVKQFIFIYLMLNH